MIVVDTNVIAYFFVPGENSKFAKSLLRKDSDWVAPILWKSEFSNVLATYMRNGQLTLQKVLLLVNEAENLMSRGAFDVNSERVMILVDDSNCSAYDCEFVALAFELGQNLITTDKRLLQSFPDITVSLKDITQ